MLGRRPYPSGRKFGLICLVSSPVITGFLELLVFWFLFWSPFFLQSFLSKITHPTFSWLNLSRVTHPLGPGPSGLNFLVTHLVLSALFLSIVVSFLRRLELCLSTNQTLWSSTPPAWLPKCRPNRGAESFQEVGLHKGLIHPVYPLWPHSCDVLQPRLL